MAAHFFASVQFRLYNPGVASNADAAPQALDGKARAPTGALAALRSATAAAHAAVEACSPLLSPKLTRQGYVAFLQRLSPLVAACEHFVLALQPMGQKSASFLAGTPRHPQLLADLRALGAAPVACHPTVYLDALGHHNSVGGRLGALYVLEGSSLGGQVLCRHLRVALALQPQHMAYLRGHGRATKARWQAARHFLEAALADDTRRQEACAAAQAVFHLFAQASVGPTP